MPDRPTLRGLRLAICRPLDRHANVRPARILPGIRSPLRDVDADDLDRVVARENSEGESPVRHRAIGPVPAAHRLRYARARRRLVATRPRTRLITEEGHADWRRRALELEAEVGEAVVGQPEVLRLITVALLARGHVLLEGDVGVGKTTVLRAFARGVGGDFERVEGTVDLMPTDLVYDARVDADGQPRIDPGPLLRHGAGLTTFFFNEINRARPQVQALLLRAMAERSVGAFGTTHSFPHMTVFADRNRVEREETFELASAARDRFLLELNMATPTDEEVRRALVFDPAYHDVDALIGRVPEGLCPGPELDAVGAAIQRLVRASPAIERYALALWRATERPQDLGVEIEGVDVERLVVAGASPRGVAALVRAARAHAWLAGRDWLAPEDVHAVAPAALGHRSVFEPVYEMRRGEIAPRLVRAILDRVPCP